MNILAVETSCDETSASVLRGNRVASLLIGTQSCHTPFGGVVPELASREHSRTIVQITQEAIEKSGISISQIDMLCATSGPGMIGSLLVGLKFVEAMSYALAKPFMAIDHMKAHVFSAFIGDDDCIAPIQMPFLALVVSGGHTMLVEVDEVLDIHVIGKTLDDAAGEAFDKTGKLLGLPYPAGLMVDKLSTRGDRNFHRFPRALSGKDTLNFSFSGLKTSVLTYVKSNPYEYVEENKNSILASIQEAIVDSLLEKTILAQARTGAHSVAVVGGVSANSRLREKFKHVFSQRGVQVFIPKVVYSTDNAAMIAVMAKLQLDQGIFPTRDYGTKAYSRDRLNSSSIVN